MRGETCTLNANNVDCSNECACPIPPSTVHPGEFQPNADAPETCPNGYAPTPVLSAATNFTSQRSVKRNVGKYFMIIDI